MAQCVKTKHSTDADTPTKMIILAFIKYVVEKEKYSFDRVQRKLREGRDPAKLTKDVFGDKSRGSKGYQARWFTFEICRWL